MAIDRFNDGANGNNGGRGGGYPPRRRFPSGGDGDEGGMYGRIPPQNIEAEMAVLGAMLLGDRGAIEKATEVLQREDFYREAHAHIYESMVTLTEKDEPVDIVTLKDELSRRGNLDTLGGVPYLMALADYVPTAANVVYYANIVAEKAVLRRLIEASGQIAGMAYGEVDEVSALVDHAERTIFEVARRRTNQAFTPLRPLLNEAFEKIDTLYHERGITTGVDTGFTDLNYITSGLQDGELIILAARPSMGKCLAAWSLIDNPLTGERVTIENYVKQQIPVVSSVTACGRINPSRISHWVDSGIKPCWRVTTRTGRSVDVTGHHPFLTANGWTPLHDLAVGSEIGVARCVPVFGRDQRLPLNYVRTLAYFLTSRSKREKDVLLAGTDPALVTELLADLEVSDIDSEHMKFPDYVWKWDRKQLVIFLQTLFVCDGVRESPDHCLFQTISEAMARDVQHALVRLGAVSQLKQTLDVYWTIRISEKELEQAWTDEARADALPDVFWDEITAIEPIGEHQVYDLTVPEGANFIAQDICVHNTSLAMGIGQNAALRAGKNVAVFSMEMSKESLVQRMICSEARVDAHRLRTGYLQDDDWTRLAEAVQRLWDANLYIDDSNDMNPLEMRAKCRRLRAEQGGLDLVIVDYLQLMSGSKKQSENRNVEITEIARGLKGLARELRAPVVALSQLSRAVEKREDKRPMLSDLRECVVGSTRLICADTGKLVAIADITPGARILAASPDQKTVTATVSKVWAKGVKPVFRVTTESGRVLECTDNHPFLTQEGYKPLSDIGAEDLVATAFHLPEYGAERPERAALCRFLGYMVGDGHYGKHRTISFISADKVVYDDAKDIIAEHFPEISFHEETSKFKQTCWEVDFVAHHKDGRHGKPGGNPLINWLRHEVGVLGQICHNKRVPDWIFESGSIGAREFLAGYLATDGCVKVRLETGKYDVHFDTVSHELARDVQHLLTRLGVVATIQNAQRKDGIYRPIWRISVNPSNDNLRRFASQIRPVGRKGEMLATYLACTPRVPTNPGLFRLPKQISALLAEKTRHLRQQGVKLPEGQVGRQYWKPQGKSLRRDICLEWAERLQDTELRKWATSDLLWEQIRSIEPAGEQETFDICMPETGNFIAEGVVVHNSGAIEAEADIVAFIYRPAYYERKEAVSEAMDEKEEQERRPGEYEGEEAEIIIAKQRNGPTGTVKLSFLPKYARFDNLAEYREESPF